LTRWVRKSDKGICRLIRQRLAEVHHLDPAETIFAELFPDGGSDFGLLIGADAIIRRFHWPWGSDVIDVDFLTEDHPIHSYALQIYGGWFVFNEEGRGPRNPIDALIPYIKWRTGEFRGAEIKRYGRAFRYDWSLPYRLLAEAGADPLATVVMHPTATVNPHPRSMGYGFLVPDGRVFVLAAVTDGDGNPVETLKWEQVNPAAIEAACGPLYEAAVRFQTEERN
jgi:hypothetical protein